LGFLSEGLFGEMTDILATLFRFRQFLFEFGPFFMAAWFGLALTTGLITVVYRKKIDLLGSGRAPVNEPSSWPGRFLLSILWYPDGKTSAVPTARALFLFSLAASIPALVATSLIDMNTVLLRVAMAALQAPSLNWLITSILLSNHGEQRPETEQVFQSSAGDKNISEPVPRASSVVRISWKSFVGQVNSALLPLLIGFALASAVTVYVPVNMIHPWLGNGAWWAPYLAALLAIPFQLSGGAEVPLASALLVKGASLGTALSVMLVAPITIFPVVRHFFQPAKVKIVAIYLAAAWLIAGSLGVVVNWVQRLFG
jgi:uncharacterized membrane protein YraQ (UPF0718 family)